MLGPLMPVLIRLGLPLKLPATYLVFLLCSLFPRSCSCRRRISLICLNLCWDLLANATTIRLVILFPGPAQVQNADGCLGTGRNGRSNSFDTFDHPNQTPSTFLARLLGIFQNFPPFREKRESPQIGVPNFVALVTSATIPGQMWPGPGHLRIALAYAPPFYRPEQQTSFGYLSKCIVP